MAEMIDRLIALVRPMRISPATDIDIYPQTDSPLLNLPAEIRIQIWKYITLSPTNAECEAWMGAYFTCKRMQDEIKKEIGDPSSALAMAKATIEAKQPAIQIEPLISPFGHEVVVHIPFEQQPWIVPPQLYSLYLNTLHINLTGETKEGDDTKSTHRILFEEPAQRFEINVKTIVITTDHLVSQCEGDTTSVSLDNFLASKSMPYTLVITQDPEGRQIKRAYSSKTRFRQQSGIPTSVASSSNSATAGPATSLESVQNISFIFDSSF